MTRKQKKVLIRIVVSAVLLLLCVLLDRFVLGTGSLWQRLLRLAMYLIPYGIIGYDVLKKAGKGILRRQVFDENLLMAIATVGAIVLAVVKGDGYTEAIAVMLFYQTGELIQSFAVGKSRRNIAALMDIRPDVAYLETENGVEECDPDDVEVGSILLVRPGEKIPIDGIVTEGRATLNTSALTGESVPRSAKVGDEVISGCVNTDGVIKVRTTKEFGASTVSKILDLVENSGLKKAKSEKFISKFARYYTPAVCAAALALALLPPVVRLLSGYPAYWGEWVYRALTFLVISCPCALVISIPLTFFAGIGGASRRGILVKGANCLETLSKTKIVALDKTGTLTRGEFTVTEACPAAGASEDALREAAAYAECFSHHPIAASILSYCDITPDTARVSEVCDISGEGVTALLDGVPIAAGNEKLMARLGLQAATVNAVGTVVHIAGDGAYLGYLLIADRVKETAARAMTALKQCGVKKTVMLTGDIPAVAEAVAQTLGVDEVHAGLLPEDKVNCVTSLLSEAAGGERLAFVGDGINDAPVLACADLGIAMGALGSDAAIEAADVVLMDDDPLKIAGAMGMAKKCMRIVYENIYFAIGIKLLCLLLGGLGIANMWLAIFADVGVMVLAVLNAVRALHQREDL